MDELVDLISHSHEAEFEYSGTTYVLQPEISEGKAWLVIWDISENGKCICKYEIPEEGDIPQEIIQKVLSEKCFNGQSFLDIEKDITVTVIY
ncbi:MAG: hypothetical protein Q4E28_01335 [Clostridia bacterium]|nr:hypothetical protein [Clostridia bacterium]